MWNIWFSMWQFLLCLLVNLTTMSSFYICTFVYFFYFCIVCQWTNKRVHKTPLIRHPNRWAQHPASRERLVCRETWNKCMADEYPVQVEVDSHTFRWQRARVCQWMTSEGGGGGKCRLRSQQDCSFSWRYLPSTARWLHGGLSRGHHRLVHRPFTRSST